MVLRFDGVLSEGVIGTRLDREVDTRPDSSLRKRGFYPDGKENYENLSAYWEVASSFGGDPNCYGFDFINGNGDYVQGDWLQTESGRVILTVELFDSCVGGFYFANLEAEVKHDGQWHPIELDGDLVESIKLVLGVE